MEFDAAKVIDEIIAFIIFPLLGAGLFTFLGLLAFNKKDIK